MLIFIRLSEYVYIKYFNRFRELLIMVRILYYSVSVILSFVLYGSITRRKLSIGIQECSFGLAFSSSRELSSALVSG